MIDYDYGGKYIPVNPHLLPNVTALMHNGTALADSIMASRPISRVCRLRAQSQDTDDFLLSFHGAASRSLVPLTHLYSGNLLEGLRDHLSVSPQPYRHLTAIGTLTFTSYKYSEVLESLRPLVVLDRLKLIEVERGMCFKPPKSSTVCSKSEFRSALGDQNPNLRVILISARETIGSGRMVGTEVWKRGESEWANYIIPYYTYWEVLKGAYDDFV